MKIKSRKVSILSIVILLLISVLNSSFSFSKAATQTGISATIQLDEDNPIQYSTIIPSPNVYSTMAIDGKNQGNFSLMNAMGGVESEINANISGQDISFMYPWLFDDFMIDSTTNNGYIDRMDVRWLNISAFDAENETLSPFTISTLWNYYTMSESQSVQVPLNSSIPIQVDMLINNLAPKLLKLSWLTDSASNPTIHSVAIVSPSGKLVNTNYNVPINPNVAPDPIFRYFGFIPHEQGTYRFLINASHSVSTLLELEFIDYELTSLSQDQILYGGTGDENPSWEDRFNSEWNSHWYKFTAQKGEFLRISLGNIYNSGSYDVNIWIPCETGYRVIGAGFGPNLIFVPIDGDVYISIESTNYYGLLRYSVLVSKVQLYQWGINQPLVNFRLSADEYKALNFSVPRDHFVRINITSLRDGTPVYGDGSTDFTIFYVDSNKLGCYDVLSPLKNKTQDGMKFYYYYMPAGNYRILIYNTDQSKDGILQISSRYQYESYDYIPINYLTYENPYPTDTIMAEFLSDEYYETLKHGKWFNFNITDPGQYKLYLSLNAEDNIGSTRISPGYDPIYMYTYDISENSLDAYELNQRLFSTDDSNGDALYLASPCRFTGIDFKFLQNGAHGLVDLYIYNGSQWLNMIDIDYSNDLKQDGNITLNIQPYDSTFEDWKQATAEDLGLLNITDPKSYYWLRINCTQNYITNPRIESIKLINSVITGDFNIVLLKDSEYEYCDFYELPESVNNDLDLFDFRVGNGDIITTKGALSYYNASNIILNGTELNIAGIESGNYKLLIIPDNWCHYGPVTVRLAVESYSHWNAHSWYNVTKNPFAYAYEITSGTPTENHKYTVAGYPKDHIVGFNSSLYKWDNNLSYYIMYCYGYVYNWTQLVVYKNGISNYSLYLLQDLPWIDNNGPNNEVMKLADNVSENGTVIEFGALDDFFGLIFQFNATEEMVSFELSVTQYQTPQIRAVSKTSTAAGSGITTQAQTDSNLIFMISIIAIIGIGAGIAIGGFLLWRRLR